MRHAGWGLFRPLCKKQKYGKHSREFYNISTAHFRECPSKIQMDIEPVVCVLKMFTIFLSVKVGFHTKWREPLMTFKVNRSDFHWATGRYCKENSGEGGASGSCCALFLNRPTNTAL